MIINGVKYPLLTSRKVKLNIQDTFNKELPADPIFSNERRQVEEACYSFVTPRVPSNPTVIHVSSEMLHEIGLTEEDVKSVDFKKIFSGAELLEGTSSFAMCYAGHQFGNWAGQLGDGRAINLCEVEHKNRRWALQLKGAGETPYSRTADGFAVLRSSVREHLCSEAMYHLGIPTTRSLSLSLTGDQVLRDMMYDGNAAYEKGAVVCRVAPSFLRFGSYQIFMARKDKDTLRTLVDYTMKHFYPHIVGRETDDYLHFFQEVVDRTLDMVIHWQRVGFVHGVMNTDNMSILGLTIDYGPYGWLEGYDPDWTPNTTDASGKRYRYGNQPNIALWNLMQLANALYPLVEDVPALEAVLKSYQQRYPKKYYTMMGDKIGIITHSELDMKLIQQLEESLQLTETDMTIFFRLLSDINPISMNKKEALEIVKVAFYNPLELGDKVEHEWLSWMKKYMQRLSEEESSISDRKNKMDAINPKYVLRNYMAQLAIDKAKEGDYKMIDDLYQLLKNPYTEQPENEQWFAKRPEWARNKVGCSMLSCSS